MCVCVCVPNHPVEAPLNRPSRRLRHVSPAPQADPKDPTYIYPRGSTWGDLFRPLPPRSLLKRSVCNSKGLLRASHFCIRAQLDTLRFRSGELGSDFVVPWSLLESFRVIPCQDSPRGRLWTESTGIWSTWAFGPPHLRTRL